MSTEIRTHAEEGEVPVTIAECTVCGLFATFHPVAEADRARAWVCRDYWCGRLKREIAGRVAAERERDVLQENLTATQDRCTKLIEQLRALKAATIVPADSDADEGDW